MPTVQELIINGKLRVTLPYNHQTLYRIIFFNFAGESVCWPLTKCEKSGISEMILLFWKVISSELLIYFKVLINDLNIHGSVNAWYLKTSIILIKLIILKYYNHQKQQTELHYFKLYSLYSMKNVKIHITFPCM